MRLYIQGCRVFYYPHFGIGCRRIVDLIQDLIMGSLATLKVASLSNLKSYCLGFRGENIYVMAR